MSVESDWTARLEDDLVENALAFLSRSIEAAAQEKPSHQDFTFAAVDLSVGVEIMLKSRLVREHWALVCADPQKAKKSSLESGEVKTITPEDAIKRLIGIANVSFKDRGTDYSDAVANVIKLRNRAAHFTLAGMDIESLRAQIEQGLIFAIWFLKMEFTDVGNHDQYPQVAEFLSTIAEDLHRIEAFVKKRLRDLEDDLKTADLCVECPTCHHGTFIFDAENEPGCRFCDNAAPTDPEETAADYVESVLRQSFYRTFKDGAEWPVFECPNCFRESFVLGIEQKRPTLEELNNSPANSWCDMTPLFQAACFSCGRVANPAEIIRCNRCSGVALDDDLCHHCWP